jgi:hypothetical protein
MRRALRLPAVWRVRGVLAYVGHRRLAPAGAVFGVFASGQVYDAVLFPVAPISFAHVQAELKLAAPLHSAIICSSYAPYMTSEVVPGAVPRELIHFCQSSKREDLEQQVRTWLDISGPEIRIQQPQGAAR